MPDHDLLFKKLLRTFLRDFLRIVSPQVAERLDFSHTIYLDKELFTDWPQGRRRELDLLARVPLLDPPDRFVLIHVEIEARAAPGIGTRLRSYRNQIQQRHEHAVISAVLFLRRGRPEVHVEILEEDLPYLGFGAFRYVAFGLEGCDAEEYLARPEPLAWGLAALMRPGSMSPARAQARLSAPDRRGGALRRREISSCGLRRNISRIDIGGGGGACGALPRRESGGTSHGDELGRSDERGRIRKGP